MPTKTGRKKPKSQAQDRFMRAAAAGKIPGVSRDVGREYVRGAHGTKVSRLPKRVGTKRKKTGRKSSRR